MYFNWIGIFFVHGTDGKFSSEILLQFLICHICLPYVLLLLIYILKRTYVLHSSWVILVLNFQLCFEPANYLNIYRFFWPHPPPNHKIPPHQSNDLSSPPIRIDIHDGLIISSPTNLKIFCFINELHCKNIFYYWDIPSRKKTSYFVLSYIIIII